MYSSETSSPSTQGQQVLKIKRSKLVGLRDDLARMKNEILGSPTAVQTKTETPMRRSSAWKQEKKLSGNRRSFLEKLQKLKQANC